MASTSTSAVPSKAFLELMCAAIAEVEGVCECRVCDVFGEVPTEICTMIFRQLDEESLVSVAGVNRRWRAICQDDPVLRKRIYKCLHRKVLKKARRYIIWKEFFRRDQDYRKPTQCRKQLRYTRT